MTAGVLGRRAHFLAWVTALGCATGAGESSDGAPLRCGPGTSEQDGYCVPARASVEPAPPEDREVAADDEPSADAGPPNEPALDLCGPCNVDEDCTERCPGTHCMRVDGRRQCVGADGLGPGDPAAAGDPTCADPCDLWEQCGCDAGQGCGFDLAGTLRCAPTGDAGQGQSCAVERCAAGLTCLADQTCAAYCDAEHPCPAGFACVVELQDWQGETFATACWGHPG